MEKPGETLAMPGPAIESKKFGIPNNFRTHRSAWRSALALARDSCAPKTEDTDDRAYWEHELAAYDRSFDRLERLMRDAEPVPPGETLAEWAVRATPAEIERANWRAVAHCVRKLRDELQKDGCRRSWIDPYLDIAESCGGEPLAASPASQSKTAIINGKPATAFSLLAALIDIYDDQHQNAPENRCYVEDAWSTTLADARQFIAAPDNTPSPAPVSQTLESKKFGIPGNFTTHRNAWRSALELARDNCAPKTEDMDDKSYWEHELAAFDRSFDSLWLLMRDADPGQTSQPAEPAPVQPTEEPIWSVWERLPGWLIDHCEGEVISEEFLQQQVAKMLETPPNGYESSKFAPPAEVPDHGELNPRTAMENAREMIAYCQSFNGQAWGGLEESVDRQNLAMALDHLEETASMLLNMADRVQGIQIAQPVAQKADAEPVHLEAEFHKAIRLLLSKKDQGRVMAAFRTVLPKR